MSDVAAVEVAEEAIEPVAEEAPVAEDVVEKADPSDETVVALDDWRSPIIDPVARKNADRFTSLDEMGRAMVDLRKRDSQIRVPGKKSSDEDRAAYNKAIGVPETSEGYDWGIPEGTELTEGDVGFRASASDAFHRLNISVEQGKGLNEWWTEMAHAAQQAEVKEDKAYAKVAEKALKAEWPGGEFERNKEYANRAAVRVFGGDFESVKMLEDKTGRYVLDNPVFVKALAAVGREMNEGRLGGVMSESEQGAVDTKISEYDKLIEAAQNDGDIVRANALMIEQQDLYGRKFGSAPVVGSEGRSA